MRGLHPEPHVARFGETQHVRWCVRCAQYLRNEDRVWARRRRGRR